MLPPSEATYVEHDVLQRQKRRAGGVLWRIGLNDVEIAVVHRRGGGPADWTLPKGRVVDGEAAAAAAVREVAEETGYRVQRGPLLGSLVSRSRSGRSKLTTYWLMTRVSGRFRGSREIDDLEWLSLEAAQQRLAGRADARLIDAIRVALAADLEATG